MYVTEEEAKQKWCPQVRKNEIADWSIANNPGLAMASHSWNDNCIGSDCMMWRGALSQEYKLKAENEFQRYGTIPEPKEKDVRGYCGLAGRPE